MKLILTKDVVDLGGKGDVVEVSDGYARNYLVPRSFAVKATEGALRQADSMRIAREEALLSARQEAEGYAQSLTGTRVVVAARSGDEGKLFGSITVRDVADACEAAGVKLEKSEVRLPEGPIRELGEFEINIHLHPEVDAVLKLAVVAEA